MGVRGEFLETDPRDDLLDRAELAVCLDIVGAAAAVRGEVLNGVVLHAGWVDWFNLNRFSLGVPRVWCDVA